MSGYMMFTLPGLILIVVSIPLLMRRVPPNPLYGLRVPATFKDERVWYDANAASARDMLVLGVAISLLAYVLPVFGVRDMMYAVAWVAVAVAGMITVGVLGWTRANRMLRERDPQGH